ncbi:HGxxPAAW family protein [Streptomyces sp. NRRL S-87]|uniref:HGxxPAAW family protein n=1 Tax=Streptomyces sp. NRRL S-87 TaxID=1463920 RepID=UPI00056C1CAF|nr:HGxxPAAW family protein [Streptomyces sp. NRRL S-87]
MSGSKGHQYDEGHTIAGWGGTAVATVGTALVGVGVCGWTPGTWLGLGVVVAAALLTWALHLAGWGKAPGPRPADQWGMGTRDASARAGHLNCLGCRLAGRRPAAGPERITASGTSVSGAPVSGAPVPGTRAADAADAVS